MTRPTKVEQTREFFKRTLSNPLTNLLSNTRTPISRSRCGYKLEPPRAYTFKNNTDRYGWTTGANNTYHYCLYVQNGRVYDSPDYQLKTGLREIAKVGTVSVSARTRVLSIWHGWECSRGLKVWFWSWRRGRRESE